MQWIFMLNVCLATLLFVLCPTQQDRRRRIVAPRLLSVPFLNESTESKSRGIAGAASIKVLNESNVSKSQGKEKPFIFHGFLGRLGNAQYFKNGMAMFRSKFAHINFIVVSDNIDWCKGQAFLMASDVHFVKNGNSAVLDMAILASCVHIILSRGTFGWWAAFLGPHAHGGVVVYHDSEFDMKHPKNKGNVNLTDFYPARWIPMGVYKDTEAGFLLRLTSKSRCAIYFQNQFWLDVEQNKSKGELLIERYIRRDKNFERYPSRSKVMYKTAHVTKLLVHSVEMRGCSDKYIVPIDEGALEHYWGPRNIIGNPNFNFTRFIKNTIYTRPLQSIAGNLQTITSTTCRSLPRCIPKVYPSFLWAPG